MKLVVEVVAVVRQTNQANREVHMNVDDDERKLEQQLVRNEDWNAKELDRQEVLDSNNCLDRKTKAKCMSQVLVKRSNDIHADRNLCKHPLHRSTVPVLKVNAAAEVVAVGEELETVASVVGCRCSCCCDKPKARLANRAKKDRSAEEQVDVRPIAIAEVVHSNRLNCRWSNCNRHAQF